MKTNTKEWIQYSTAIAMVASGIIMSFMCYFAQGDVADGILWYMGQGLTFAGAIFGVSVYFHTKIGESKSEIKNYFDTKFQEDEKRRGKTKKQGES